VTNRICTYCSGLAAGASFCGPEWALSSAIGQRCIRNTRLAAPLVGATAGASVWPVSHGPVCLGLDDRSPAYRVDGYVSRSAMEPVAAAKVAVLKLLPSDTKTTSF